MDPYLLQLILARRRQQQQQQQQPQQPQNPMAGGLGLGQAGLNMLQGGGIGALTNRNPFAKQQPFSALPNQSYPPMQTLPYIQQPGAPQPQPQPMPYQYNPNQPIPPDLLQLLSGYGSPYGSLGGGGGSMWPSALPLSSGY